MITELETIISRILPDEAVKFTRIELQYILGELKELEKLRLTNKDKSVI